MKLFYHHAKYGANRTTHLVWCFLSLFVTVNGVAGVVGLFQQQIDSVGICRFVRCYRCGVLWPSILEL